MFIQAGLAGPHHQMRGGGLSVGKTPAGLIPLDLSAATAGAWYRTGNTMLDTFAAAQAAQVAQSQQQAAAAAWALAMNSNSGHQVASACDLSSVITSSAAMMPRPMHPPIGTGAKITKQGMMSSGASPESNHYACDNLTDSTVPSARNSTGCSHPSRPPSPAVSVITISSSDDDDSSMLEPSTSSKKSTPRSVAGRHNTWPSRPQNPNPMTAAANSECRKMTAVVKPIDVKKEIIDADESSNSSVGIPSLVPTGMMHHAQQQLIPMAATMFAAQQQASGAVGHHGSVLGLPPNIASQAYNPAGFQLFPYATAGPATLRTYPAFQMF